MGHRTRRSVDFLGIAWATSWVAKVLALHATPHTTARLPAINAHRAVATYDLAGQLLRNAAPAEGRSLLLELGARAS
jgi:hypothetical protein